MQRLSHLITATDSALRNQSLDAICQGLSIEDLLKETADLDLFRRRSENLYEKVRALFFFTPFIASICRRVWLLKIPKTKARA